MEEGWWQRNIKGALTTLFGLDKRTIINLTIICVIIFCEILAISSEGWQANSTTNYGLWSTCIANTISTCCLTLDTSDGCLNTTRAFLIMAILSTFATLGVMIYQIRSECLSADCKKWLLIPLICTAFCLFIAVMVYGICNNNAIDDASLSWSFGICVTTMLISVFHIVGYCIFVFVLDRASEVGVMRKPST